MKVLVFSGTTEGKEIAYYLSSLGIDTTVSVATEYGKAVMETAPYITIHVGRMDYDEMLKFAKAFELIIDATHPYAQLVTENIKKVAEELNIEYIRLLRPDTSKASENEMIIHVSNVSEAAQYLIKNALDDEKIFISTGSKELDKYVDIPDFQNKLVVRVLPAKESEEKCKQLELSNVIYEKGPFSLEQNINAFLKYDVKWLVTKSAGKAGGFDEKINAAKHLDIKTIIIDRPIENGGFDIDTVKQRILEKSGRQAE